MAARMASALFSLCVIAAAARGSGAESDAPRNAVGFAIGVPQTIAVAYDRILAPRWELCTHVGTAVLLSGAGVRMRYGSHRNGIRPYVFGGGALIHARAEGYGDPEDTAAYLWLGPGVQLLGRRGKLFVEVSGLVGGDPDRGLGDDWIFPFSPAISGGLMVRF